MIMHEAVHIQGKSLEATVGESHHRFGGLKALTAGQLLQKMAVGNALHHPGQTL